MDIEFIATRMQGYTHRAAQELSAWLSDILPKTSEDWWNECVLDKLSNSQRATAKEKGFSSLSDLDLAALLRIADKSWYEMRNVRYLPPQQRECIRDMMRVRNNWAHLIASIPGKDYVINDLKTLSQFFAQLNCDHSLLDEIASFIQAVEKPGSIAFKEQSIQPPTPSPAAASDKEIKEKDLVYLIGDPDKRGMVYTVEDIGETIKYQLFIDGGISTYYSGQIALVEEHPDLNWVDADTFRSFLTAYQINNPSARNLYSLNSARIDFVPYQFRPALKLIHADEPRILIADSVGVGKTIEAGLIIKELEGRSNLENILVICPKPLVSERKWEQEMKRFDEDFVPLDGPELRQALSDTDRDGEWPIRYSKAIIPYSILDSRIYGGSSDDKGRKRKKTHCFSLSELDPAPHFDLVIVDEAHHIRNGSMEKEKAFAYKCVKFFCDHADAVVMLTATPLQNSNDDLFTLMNVLRPDVIIDKDTFKIMTGPNQYISECSHIIRTAGENWQNAAIDALQNVLKTEWGENVTAKNPVYKNVLARLQQDTLARDDRVRLISDVESLHSLNTMLNRTRRKDIQDFCIRRPYTIETEFTPYQQELHNELLYFEEKVLSWLHDSNSVLFMMNTIRRQAASCLFGLAPYIKNIINRRFKQMNEDSNADFDIEELSEAQAGSVAEMAKHLFELAQNLPKEDPKFDKLLEIIRQKQSCENNKIMLFSTFLYTLDYLEEKLSALGFRVGRVDGSVKDEDRLKLRERFEKPKDDPKALDLLLFTEVGSEGLDYQFCDTMINYDLPWNPMKIEQRIGRIDRRGQKSEIVNIYNIITAGTVDAAIYERCLDKIGIFESSIGECEEILAEIGTKIEQLAVDRTLTEEERKRKLDQIADNEVRKMQALTRLEDEGKELFGFNLSNITASKEIQRAESPWLSPLSIQKMVEHYLHDRLDQKGDASRSYIMDAGSMGSMKTLRLNALAREKLLSDFSKVIGTGTSARHSWYKHSWRSYLKGTSPSHFITFDAEAAEQNRKAFFITSMHPLARQAAMHYATNETAYINLSYASDTLPSGQYPFSVYAWNYTGLNPHFRLVTVCDNDAVSDELIDILQNAQASASSISADKSTWQPLEGKHVQMWMAEKNSYLQDVQAMAAFKLESLRDNFYYRKLNLTHQIQNTDDYRITRMRQGELKNATEIYERKSQAVKETAARADIHVTLIANGIITVR